MSPRLKPQDLSFLRETGISEASALRQLEWLRRGARFIPLQRPCQLGDGIRRLSAEEKSQYAARYRTARDQGRAMKFVPASGAASRMFQDLLVWMQAPDTEALPSSIRDFFAGLRRAPFFEALEKALRSAGISPELPVKSGQEKTWLRFLLTSSGLNFAALPKALIPFHRYATETRSALQEQVRQGARYLSDSSGRCRFHFTVGAESLPAVREQIAACRVPGVQWEVGLSQQAESTRTLACDEAGAVLRDAEGNVLLRPGGHGALLKNLQDSGGDLVFIQNIDNVAYDRETPQRFLETEAMGGLLVDLQNRSQALLQKLRAAPEDPETLAQAAEFLRENFSLEVSPNPPEVFDRLRRPIRVCGMVLNRNEPGGGPFWVKDEAGGVSVQIVESSQVDPQNSEQQKIFRASTHFNPVDLVCGLRDDLGNPHDLEKYSDPSQVFIAKKSHQGRPLFALEWPGLWNGAMAHWNTVFVEISEASFTPVKTVFDLLKPEHQP